MQLNDLTICWPLMFLKRSDSEPKLAEGPDQGSCCVQAQRVFVREERET